MNPIGYSAGCKAIVDAFDALPDAQKNGDYWGEIPVNPVRSEIKAYYIKEQHFKCVYCDRQIVTANHSLWDAEHIISRKAAPRFMFNPENLAVSCRDCNNAKREHEVRRNKNRKSFPKKSEHYSIFHAHYGVYQEHIRWVGDICVPISKKGTQTLIACDLTRFTAELLGMAGIINDPAFDQQVGQLMKAKTKVEAQAQLAAINVYIENIPQTP
ncbi:HNH endonuclease (plasmid) [Rhizobium sp. B230/85]|uniref:HNH endonuclease n=1 Tax=unclassified Rhizobium TaxID=2613769 RepID=UPI001ADD256A|nr:MULTISPECIES: HNH endonuclease [unclassified Rhizobium]MBO9136200.1 HNH endonuclease [Rhizobium sp. B209b/85]QXZ99890.1 HNH endonuclease [Rhizobium sp. B230/85]